MRVDGYLKIMGPPYAGNTDSRSVDMMRNANLRTGRTPAADDDSSVTGDYRVSLSKKGKVLSASEFQRDQKEEEYRFDKDQKRDFVAFKQQQSREAAAFEREQQRKLSEFKRKIDNDHSDPIL